MALELYQPENLQDVCRILAGNKEARPLAGGTDLLSRQERGVALPTALVSMSGLGLNYLRQTASGGLQVGPLVTHAVAARSEYLRSWAPVLAEACLAVGSPQVRNLGTLGGNLCNASPAADAATALLSLGAIVEITGPDGVRSVPVEEFFLEPGRTVLKDGEVLSGITLPSPAPWSSYYKLGRRKALEIAVVGVAVALDMEGTFVKGCRVGLAAVAPIPLRARQAEAALAGRELTGQVVEEAARAAERECRPITDFRASADYRRSMVEVLFKRAVKAATERGGRLPTEAFPSIPLHEEKSKRIYALEQVIGLTSSRVTLKVNGENYALDLPTDKLLADVLRENLGLTGTKKGCGEGECGTCTVLVDGLPVNACLVLAVTMEGREISTVEGLAKGQELHPLQKAFIQEGAVQCGYCTAGMLMSGSALLKERPRADEQEIKTALSGNLCRCTGYKKIIKAVQTAEREILASPSSGV